MRPGPGHLGSALVGLAAFLVPPAQAQDAARRIAVIGSAGEDRVPDYAEVEIGVVSRGRTPAAALDGASSAARGIVATARDLGVPEAEISTTALRLDAQTRQVRQPDGSLREQSDGFEAANRIRVRLADDAKLGELMRRALDAGANRIEGVTFGLRDPAGAEAAVQVAAMRDARTRAERLAEAAGVKLGPAQSITAPPRGGEPGPRLDAARARIAAAGAPVPVEAGRIALRAEVEAVFAIEP